MTTTIDKKLRVTILSDTTAQFTRQFNAPRALVFEAMSKCEHMQKWWGPRRLTNPICEMDFRPGGAWRIVQRDTEGNEFPFRGEYLEIVPVERIKQTFIYDVAPFEQSPSIETMTLTEEGGITTLTVIAEAASKEAQDAMLESGMEEGAAESYDRLEEYLRTMPAPAGRELVITRTLQAPRQLVWDAWTNPEHAKHWLGPNGFTALAFEMDARPGGDWHSNMRGPDGTEHANRGTVREATEPERLAFTFAWDEPDGRPGREMVVTVELAERGSRTEMTFTQSFFESVEDRDGHEDGWSQSFGRLEQYLATR